MSQTSSDTRSPSSWCRNPQPWRDIHVHVVSVGIAELRQNLSVYLRRVANGERLVVTDRNRPVAEIGPPSSRAGALDRLIAEGRVAAPIRLRRPEPLVIDAEPDVLGRALEEVRGDTIA